MSCSDFLDQIPEEKLSEDNLFKSKDDAIKVLTQAYSYYYSPLSFTEYVGQASDEMDFNWNNYAPYYKDVGQYAASNPIYNTWKRYYEAIRTCIYFQDNIDKCQDIKLRDDERSWWKGEAYFLEAYYYFLLLSSYGPVPIIDKVYNGQEMVDITENGLARAHFDKCVEYIDSLLIVATNHLDLFYTSSISDRAGRASKASAMFLRSRLWLYAASPLYNGMRNPAGNDLSSIVPKDKNGTELISAQFDVNKWKKAMDISKAAIDTCLRAGRNLYTPSPTANGYESYWRMINYARGGDPNIENVFYKQNFSVSDYRTHSLPKRFGGYQGVCPTLEHVNEYFMANGLMTEDQAGYAAETGFDSYTANGHSIRIYKKFKNRDPRFYCNILFPGQYSYAVLGNETESTSSRWAIAGSSVWEANAHYQSWFDGLDGYGSITGRDFSINGFLCIKYMHRNDTPSGKADNGFAVFRLAELYLNYSEAALEYYAATDVDPATKSEVFQYWDLIRDRVQLPRVVDAYNRANIALTVTKLRTLIQRERMVELAFEGHRYFDNRRWMIAEKEGGAKHGFDIYKNETAGFWNENYVFETRAWYPRMYFLPIAQTEIDKNRQLTNNYGW
jgi:hypothetical protein